MNFDISVVCNCNSFLFYVLNKLVPSLHLENLWIPYHYAGRIVSLWDHSFPPFIKKNTDNAVVTISLPPALSFYWVCDLLCSHLEELLPNKEVDNRWKQKTIGEFCVLASVAHLSFLEYIGGVFYYFWKRTRPSKKGMWYHRAKLSVPESSSVLPDVLGPRFIFR